MASIRGLATYQYTYMGIDPGETSSGYAIITKSKVLSAGVITNDDLLLMIKDMALKSMMVIAFEDIINPHRWMRKQTLATCQFIGALKYVLAALPSVKSTGYERVKVRHWVYGAMPEVCEPRVIAKIAALDDQGKRLGRKRYVNSDGITLRKPSFQFVDDRITVAAMKELFGIPTPKPGKANQYGLKSHSWQALAVVAMHIYKDP